MAKTTKNTRIGNEVKSPAAPAPARTTTAVRNTPLPKSTPAPRKEITHDLIARRAYEISMSGGGSEFDNWLRAERELKGL